MQLTLRDTALVDHYCVASENVLDDKWHNVAATWDGNVIVMYVDVAQDDDICHFSGTLMTNNESLWTSCQNNTDYLGGLVDDIRVYKKALTTAQIQQHYAEGLKDHLALASK